MAKRTTYSRFCPLSRAMDILGERWTMVIINELLMAPRRYTDLRNALPGMGANVLSERLQRLESAGISRRVAGSAGQPVVYELTERGLELGPALAELRKFGADILLLADGVDHTVDCPTYDMSYALTAEDGDELPTETFQWEIEDHISWVAVDGVTVTQGHGPAPDPVLTLRASRSFVHRLCEGQTTWDEGLATGEVTTFGDQMAWDRMHAATGDPSRRGLNLNP